MKPASDLPARRAAIEAMCRELCCGMECKNPQRCAKLSRQAEAREFVTDLLRQCKRGTDGAVRG